MSIYYCFEKDLGYYYNSNFNWQIPTFLYNRHNSKTLHIKKSFLFWSVLRYSSSYMRVLVCSLFYWAIFFSTNGIRLVGNQPFLHTHLSSCPYSQERVFQEPICWHRNQVYAASFWGQVTVVLLALQKKTVGLVLKAPETNRFRAVFLIHYTAEILHIPEWNIVSSVSLL